MAVRAPLVVLDDDPTGAQALAGVPYLFDVDEAALLEAAAARPPAVHLLTNSRALDPSAAERLVADWAGVARRALPGSDIVLRGDSTLRGHLLAEHRGLRAACFPDAEPVLLLVPALPAAGRVTVGGVHLLERDGVRIPLDRTEYARDPVLGYRDARLLRWADERSGGYFPADAGRTIGLAELRRTGGGAVAAALAELAASGGPAVCVPDAEVEDDLRAVAAGLREAQAAGAAVAVRCAPTFVGVLSGALARQRVAPPAVAGPVLVVCGSFVPGATRQLTHLSAVFPGTVVEADIAALASADASRELRRLAAAVDLGLRRSGLAVLATPRRPPARGDAGVQARVAANLAAVLPLLRTPPAAVIAKGGVTAAVTAREGLAARRADVVGPVADGVSWWDVRDGRGGTVPYLVVPGNVGDDDLLVRLVALVVPRSARAVAGGPA